MDPIESQLQNMAQWGSPAPPSYCPSSSVLAISLLELKHKTESSLQRLESLLVAWEKYFDEQEEVRINDRALLHSLQEQIEKLPPPPPPMEERLREEVGRLSSEFDCRFARLEKAIEEVRKPFPMEKIVQRIKDELGDEMRQMVTEKLASIEKKVAGLSKPMQVIPTPSVDEAKLTKTIAKRIEKMLDNDELKCMGITKVAAKNLTHQMDALGERITAEVANLKKSYDGILDDIADLQLDRVKRVREARKIEDLRQHNVKTHVKYATALIIQMIRTCRSMILCELTKIPNYTPNIYSINPDGVVVEAIEEFKYIVGENDLMDGLDMDAFNEIGLALTQKVDEYLGLAKWTDDSPA